MAQASRMSKNIAYKKMGKSKYAMKGMKGKHKMPDGMMMSDKEMKKMMS